MTKNRQEIEKILDNTDFGLVLTYSDEKQQREIKDKIYNKCIDQLLTLQTKYAEAEVVKVLEHLRDIYGDYLGYVEVLLNKHKDRE